jgi:hypothetical protein
LTFYSSQLAFLPDEPEPQPDPEPVPEMEELEQADVPQPETEMDFDQGKWSPRMKQPWTTIKNKTEPTNFPAVPTFEYESDRILKENFAHPENLILLSGRIGGERGFAFSQAARRVLASRSQEEKELLVQEYFRTGGTGNFIDQVIEFGARR